MKSKVTVKEMVGTKMIYAVLLACYYWMWARQDWQDYYSTIQHVVIVFTIVFFAIQAGRIYQYGKQGKDELAIQNLRKADAILLKIMAAAVILIICACAATFLDGRMAGYALAGMLFLLTAIRFLLFCVMDRKEACCSPSKE